MQVVNGVAPVILNVPAESWEHHTDVKPGHLHPRDVSIDVTQQGLLQHGHHVQVPATAGVFLNDRGKLTTQHWTMVIKKAAK